MAAAHCTAEDAPVRALSKLRCAAFVNRAQNDAIQTVDLRSVQFLSYTGSFFLGAPCHVLKHNSYFLPLTPQIVKSVAASESQTWAAAAALRGRFFVFVVISCLSPREIMHSTLSSNGRSDPFSRRVLLGDLSIVEQKAIRKSRELLQLRRTGCVGPRTEPPRKRRSQ